MRHNISLPLLLIGVIGLSGCAPLSTERAAECKQTTTPLSPARLECLKQASRLTVEDNKRTKAEKAALACEGFGFTKGTPTFAQCVFQQQQIEMQSEAAAQALRIQQQQLGLQQIQQGMQMMTPPKQLNPSITCTHFPGSFTTTCQ